MRMNKKQLLVFWTIAILFSIILYSPGPLYSAWTEYKNTSYIDLDGDFVNEIVIESKHGAGSGH